MNLSPSLQNQINLNDYIPEVQEILQLEGNNVCADCVSSQVSCLCVTTRVILCQRCAYIHMKLGYEIKLLTDKQWDPQLLSELKMKCNTVSRQEYEYSKPSWQITPFSFDSNIIREYWIQEKYKNKAFMYQEGETEEQIYKSMMSKVEDIERKKVQEEVMRSNWYYLEPTDTETKMNGPFSKHEIISFLNHDQIDESFYCWHPSFENWEQVIDIKELDLDKRDFKIIKDVKSIMDDVTPKMLKYIPRVLRGNLECRIASSGVWKKYWVVFALEALSLYKTVPDRLTKPDVSVRMNSDDWMIEVKEVVRDKNKTTLGFEIYWPDYSLSFTGDNTLEIIEWVHNFRKYHLFRAKFGGRLPLYDDKLNPFKTNVLGIEGLLASKLKFGSLMKEPNGFFESGLQAKWFELTPNTLCYYDSAKDAGPKNQWNITKEWKVYLGSDSSKVASSVLSKKIFHFQIELNKNAIIHLWDSSDEGRQEWIALIQKTINMKKQEQLFSKGVHHHHHH